MITLATLPQATAQEVYNQVKEHLLKQGQKSVFRYGCAYRGDAGLRCAAGCLISDDEYIPSLEGLDWFALQTHNLVPDAHGDLIYSLQGVHDSKEPNEWESALAKVALEHNLIP